MVLTRGMTPAPYFVAPAKAGAQAKRHALMTLIRQVRQCRDYFWRPCCLQLRLSAPTAPSF